ncbi:MAG: hypothetical protein M1825_002726 [Sarcosagium campestre]|nr:MAG: hypothetical protein M1825_002726 [Sarcosagium campestre]
MNAGGLAQMSYSSFPSNGGLGVPGSGFATRGKGSHIKRLSVQPPNPAGIDPANNPTPTPRTSRSHLLAGLRTAPRSPALPPSAPASQQQHRTGLDGSKYADADQYSTPAATVPKTAIGNGYPQQQLYGYPVDTMNGNRQMYSVPEQVLAPPSISPQAEVGDDQMDPELFAELCATNAYLAQQQQRLQQQLVNVTAAAQQFQGLGFAHQMPYGQPQFGVPGGTPTARYGGQTAHAMQPIISPVAGAQPGLYTIYNPATGQQSLYLDPNAQQTQLISPPSSSPETCSPTSVNQSQWQSRSSPPPSSNSPPTVTSRNVSPPKLTTTPPQDSPCLPPPSANAFRRGHNKTKSFVGSVSTNSPSSFGDGPKTSVPRSAGFPQTPMTGTFGPGQNRAGEHPVRQPRGPPPMEELKEKPTTKFEGGKNFATRQRRRALNSLVRAGIERRGARGSGSTGSTESMTPVSESEITFSFSSDNDSDSHPGGSLSGKPSLGSLRAVASGAIGSERKELRERSRERGSIDSQSSSASSNVEAGAGVMALDGNASDGARKMPMLVLTSAEKRKSSMM